MNILKTDPSLAQYVIKNWINFQIGQFIVKLEKKSSYEPEPEKYRI